jgi:hypothetical protein
MYINQKVLGINQSIAVLNQLDRELVKELRKDLALAASPLVNAIKANIPTSAPIRGFAHNGRTAWPQRPVKLQVKLLTSRSKRRQRTETVKIIMTNAGVEIADMAGKKNAVQRSGTTRAYAKGNVIMRHRLNGQGKFMIEALNQTGRGKASRYIYPAVDKYEQRIRMEIDKTIESAIIRGSEELNKKVA